MFSRSDRKSCLKRVIFEASGTMQVCQIYKYLGNLKKYLPKKADCMVSYRCNSFQVDIDISIIP